MSSPSTFSHSLQAEIRTAKFWLLLAILLVCSLHLGLRLWTMGEVRESMSHVNETRYVVAEWTRWLSEKEKEKESANRTSP
jgi:CHASE3 domain sensor protein